MKETNHTIPTTSEEIAREKAELLRQIRMQKEVINNLTKHFFAPSAPVAVKPAGIAQLIGWSTGIFKKAMLGFRIIRRVRNLFRWF